MKKLILIVLLLLVTSFAYAENKVYYDNAQKKEVCDLEGKKTLQQINSEFKGNFKDITAERKAQEELGVLEAKQKAKDKEDARKVKEATIKTKLGLSTQDFKDLKEALGD